MLCTKVVRKNLFKMKSIFFVLIFAIATPALSNEQILGEFSTVSESACNSEIHFFKNGKGVFIDSCRSDDGSHAAEIDKQNITWYVNNKKIVVKINGLNKVFTYHKNLSCHPFGEKGYSNGLIGFDLYFWRKSIECK